MTNIPPLRLCISLRDSRIKRIVNLTNFVIVGREELISMLHIMDHGALRPEAVVIRSPDERKYVAGIDS